MGFRDESLFWVLICLGRANIAFGWVFFCSVPSFSCPGTKPRLQLRVTSTSPHDQSFVSSNLVYRHQASVGESKGKFGNKYVINRFVLPGH